MSFFAAVEVFFGWPYARSLSFRLLLLCHHCQVCCLTCDAFCKVCCFCRCDDLLYLFEVFVAWMQKRRSRHFKIVMKGVESYDQSDAIPYCSLLGHRWLKPLYQLLDFGKDRGGFFFVSQGLYDSGVVQKFFKDWVDHTLAYLGANSPQCLPTPLGIALSNDDGIEVGVNSLFDDLWCYGVVFLFLSCLCRSSRLGFGLIDDVPDLFFFKHGLGHVSPLGPILEATELFALWLSIVRFYGHCNGEKWMRYDGAMWCADRIS